MKTYRCPNCGSNSVSWDTLSRVFVCHVTSCSTWFPPPNPADAESAEDLLARLSLGLICVPQSWIDTHGAAVQSVEILKRLRQY